MGIRGCFATFFYENFRHTYARLSPCVVLVISPKLYYTPRVKKNKTPISCLGIYLRQILTDFQNFLPMHSAGNFYSTCNHRLSLTCVQHATTFAENVLQMFCIIFIAVFLCLRPPAGALEALFSDCPSVIASIRPGTQQDILQTNGRNFTKLWLG